MKKTTKKSLKSFVVGIIITTMFMSTAVGAQVKNTIDVIFNSINITVNGEDQDIDNFLYEGTTYVPLRAISEIFDKEVNWDGETKTASVKDIEVGEDKAEIIALTQDELAYFNGGSFFNGDYLNIRNQFLSSLYSQPKEINLFELFYCGSGISEKITDDELKAVMVKNEITGSIEDIPCPCEKNSRSNMDKILSEHMGITLADTNEVGLDYFTYLSQYDSYYHLHGDTNYRTSINFSSGEREGNVVRLFYKDTFFADGDKVLTLREKNSTYLFVANEKVDEDLIIDIGNSTQFTKKEIAEAINVVKDNFKFPASTLTKVWYNEEESDKFSKLYLESGKGSVNGVKPENVIILLSNFDVDDSGDNPVLNPDSTYENYQWIVIRDNKTSDWRIDDWGY